MSCYSKYYYEIFSAAATISIQLTVEEVWNLKNPSMQQWLLVVFVSDLLLNKRLLNLYIYIIAVFGYL